MRSLQGGVTNGILRFFLHISIGERGLLPKSTTRSRRRIASCKSVGLNQHPFHLVERHFLGAAVVELRRACRGMVRHLRRFFERAAVLQISGASWLNMAESELGVLLSQCLDRRIADRQKLKAEIAARETDRNKYHTKAD
jgi:hypothetical protein